MRAKHAQEQTPSQIRVLQDPQNTLVARWLLHLPVNTFFILEMNSSFPRETERERPSLSDWDVDAAAGIPDSHVASIRFLPVSTHP